VLDNAIAATIFIVIILWMFFFPRILSYQIDDEGVSVKVLGRFVPLRVRHDEIRTVERMSWGRAFLLNFQSMVGRRQWNWSNRLLGERVVIDRADGTLFILTPDDPDQFLRDLERRGSSVRSRST
jgi:hypothetical protein